MVGGLDMAYFLGNKQYGRLRPIKLVDEKGEKIPDKLLDILRFTTSFETEQDLKDYLMSRFLIEDNSANLCYLISKGSKDKRYYEIIKQGDTLYLSEAAKYLSPPALKKYMDDHKFDSAFLSHLLSFYLKKYGLLNLAIKRFKEKTYKYEDLSNNLNSLLQINFSQDLKRYLLKIKDLIDDQSAVDIYGNISLTDAENAYFQSLIDNLHYNISQDDDDIRLFVNFFRSMYRFPIIPAIQVLENISSICHYITTVGTSDMDNYEEYENLRSQCDKFVSLIIYTYDRITNDYVKVNGQYKINERNLCDLAMFIANYEDYIDKITATLSYSSKSQQPSHIIEEDYDREEFLEESDFARYGQSSEDYGYNLHYGDGSNRW